MTPIARGPVGSAEETIGPVMILGYGQLGRALVAGLTRKAAFPLTVWTRRDVPGAERQPGATFVAGDGLGPAVAGVRTVVLAVSDGAVAAAAEKLAELDVRWPGKAVLHAAGALGPEVLDPLAARGAATAVCHPLRAFPVAERPEHARAEDGGPAPFAGALFTVSGRLDGVRAARRLVRELGGVALESRVADRVRYHLAATIAANYGLALRAWSTRCFEEAGLASEEAARAADALMRNALDNALATQGDLPLTGPIRRGDLSTLGAHLSALSGPERLAYAAFGLLLLDRAVDGGGEAAGMLAGRVRAADGIRESLSAVLEGARESLPSLEHAG